MHKKANNAGDTWVQQQHQSIKTMAAYNEKGGKDKRHNDDESGRNNGSSRDVGGKMKVAEEMSG